jgi:chaperone required for assembly of F1-ATPase
MSGDDQRETGVPGDKPRNPGQNTWRAALPKKFYQLVDVVAVGEGFQIRLDGRSVKTPKKRPLELPRQTLAEAVALEWRSQVEVINPATMPLTRIANTAIDAVADSMPAVSADVVAYAGSDFLCYRAEGPARLVARQAAAWDPVLGWVQTALGGRFTVSHGIMPVVQSNQALLSIARTVAEFDAFRLSALHVLTTLTGSALLALCRASNAIEPEAAWNAAHIDEDWQFELWGPDEEAAARRQLRLVEFNAADTVLTLLRD